MTNEEKRRKALRLVQEAMALVLQCMEGEDSVHVHLEHAETRLLFFPPKAEGS